MCALACACVHLCMCALASVHVCVCARVCVHLRADLSEQTSRSDAAPLSRRITMNFFLKKKIEREREFRFGPEGQNSSFK